MAIAPQGDEELRGCLIRSESVSGTGLFIWERALKAEGCYATEEIAMLVLWLPIIIFEVVLEA